MNTNTLAAGVIGFLLGGLVVSIAAQLEEDGGAPPAHSSGQQVVVHNGATIQSGR
ncbi:MAG: hypothetical protein M3165_07975 [Actinomycetota bacterium]|nr:hypothetical protein [Actinomycetota bacterium]